jgi:hypothetical protein
MLSDAERGVLNAALEKYRPGQSEPILVGGNNRLKPALRLMSDYRLVIEEIKDAKVITSYTRWVDAVQVRGAENQEVYLTFSPRFVRIWLDSKKRLLDYAAQKPGHIGLRTYPQTELTGATLCQQQPILFPLSFSGAASQAPIAPAR